MKFLFVLAQLGATVVRAEAWNKMHFANCAALAVVLFTALTQDLRLCSSAEAGIVLIVLKFEQKMSFVFL